MSLSTERTQNGSLSVSSSRKSGAVRMNEMPLKERRKLVKGFTDFLESSGSMECDIYEALKVKSKGDERQLEVLMEPVKNYCQELRERFEKMGGERWPLEIIGVMRENGVETVEELRELCENGAEMLPGASVDDAKTGKNGLALLQDAWNQERETLFRELNKLKEEKRLAEEAVSKYKKALKEEREASGEWRELLRKQESEPKEARKTREIRETSVSSKGLEVVRKWSANSSEDEFSMRGKRGEFSDSERSWGEDWKSGRGGSGSAGNEVMMGMVASMGRMMKASALPEPKTFDGTGDFKEFKRAFLLKYQQVTDEDDELVAILEERYLKGAAKALFKSLGDRHERPIAELFVEFERKLRKRQGDAKAEALHEFDRLQRTPGQKLWEYLVEVETWSKKAYPEVEKATLSQMRTTKLMRATENDDMLQSVLVAKRLELPLKDQYEHLKDIVLQRENEKLRKEKEKMGRWRGQGNSEGRRSPEGSNDGDRRTVGERRDSGAKMKCFTCGGIGHGSRQCVSKRVDSVQIHKASSVKNVGTENVEMVEMLGQRRQVVIDSGAVVSVISTSAYEKLKAGCGNWEKEVEVLGKPAFTLLNASNSEMRVRGQIKIPMVVRGRKVGLVFQLVQNWVEKILIGTNAFESIGVELKWKDPYGVVNAEENAAEVQISGGEKKLERSGEKLRKVPNEVSEIQCKNVAVRGERGRGTSDVGKVKVKIRANVAVIGPRLAARGPGVLEYRHKTMTGWTQKFDWGEVKEAVVLIEYTEKVEENIKRLEFVKSIAREVESVWIVPGSLQCVFGDVANVAKQWRGWLKTSTNVEVVDPLMTVGKHKIPLILEKWNQKSLDGLRQYLRMALPIHSTGCQLKKDEQPDRGSQFGLKTDVAHGEGHPMAERRGKWLRRVSNATESHGRGEIKGEKARGIRTTQATSEDQISSSDIEQLNSIIKSLQEKIVSQEDQIFDILVENSILKDQLEQKEKRENSAHLQLVMNLQQTIVDQSMTMKDQNLKIKILSSQLETLKSAKVEEPKQKVVLSGEGKPMEEGIPEKKRVSILRIRSVPVSSYWPTGETRIVQRKASNLELRSVNPTEKVEKSWSKFCIKDSESPQTSKPPMTLDQQSLLTESQAILNPETLKTELADTEKLLSENPTSSVLEQKILEVEYANRQISMIIETNDLQKAEDDSRHGKEMQALRDKIEDLEKVIDCLKKI